MKTKSKYIRALLEELSERTKESFDNKGFSIMSDAVSKGNISVSDRYLREQLFDRLIQAEQNKEEELEIQLEKPDLIAAFLGYGNYRKFTKAVDSPIPSSLLSLEGNWYSYVRSNSGNDEILRAPLRIEKIENWMRVVMSGMERSFEGELLERGGNAMTMMDSKEGKSFCLVLKLGLNKKPGVLQGVFAGISSGGDPICGREVLVRQEVEFNDLTWQRISLKSADKDKSTDRRIISFFQDYKRNCIKVTNVSHFDMNDLTLN